MAITAAELSIKVDADTGAAEKGLASVDKATSGLGKALGGVAKIAGGFVLGSGILAAPGALLGMAEAAAADAASMAQLEQAVSNAEGSFGPWQSAIDDAISAGQELAFSDDDVRESLSLMTAMTGDAGTALDRLGTAQDLARGTGMDLTQASKLLGKVTDENVGVLKRYGIVVGENATAQDLMNAVDAKFGGQAAAFAESDAGKLAILKDRWGELQETIGYMVLPVLAAAVDLMLGSVIPALELVGGAVAGFVQYLAYVVTSGDTLNDFLTHMPESMRPAAKAIGELVLRFRGWLGIAKDVLAQVRGPLTQAWGLLGTALALVRPHIDTIKRVFGDLATIWKGPLGNAISGMIKGFGKDGLAGILPGAIDGLKNFVLAFFDLGQIAKDVFNAIDWAALGQDILDGLGAALDAASGLKDRLFTALAEVFGALDWAALAGDAAAKLGAAWGALTDAAGAVYAWISGSLGAIDWAGLATSLAGYLGTAWGALVDAATYVYTWITAGLGAIDWVGLATSLAGYLGAAWSALVDAATYVYAWISAGLGAIDWAGIAAQITGYLGAAWAATTDAAGYIYRWISLGITGVDWAGLGTQITTSLSGALSAAAGATEGAGSGLLAMLGIDKLGEQIAPIMAAIEPFTTIMRDQLLAALQAFQPVLAALAPAWASLQATFADLVPHMQALLPALELLGKVVGTTVLLAFTGLAVVIRLFAEGLAVVLIGAIKLVVIAFESMGDIVGIAADQVAGMINIVTNLIHGDWSGAWQAAQDMVSNMVDGVNDLLGGLPGTVIGFISGLVSDVLDWFQSLWDGAVDKVSGMVESVQGFISDMVSTVTDFFATLYSNVTGKAGEIAQGVQNKVSGMVESVQGFIEDMVTTVTDFFQTLYDDVTGKVGDLVEEAVRLIGNLPGDALAALGDLSSYLYDAGVQLMQGMIDGVTSMAKDLAQAAIDVVVGAKDAALAAVGIHSPSTVMIAAGEDFVRGFIIGMDAEQQAAVGKAAEIATAVIAVVRDMLALGQQILASGDQDWSIEDIAFMLAKKIELLVQAMQQAAATFSTEGMAAAKALADAAGPIIALVQGGLEAFARMATSDQDFSIEDIAYQFAKKVELLVQAVQQSAVMFKRQGLAAAKRFAESAGPIVAIVADAAAAFAILKRKDTDESIEDIAFRFGKKIELLVQAIAAGAQTFKAKGLAAARDFAVTGAEVFDLLKAASDFDGLPQFGAHFKTQIEHFFGHVVLAVKLLLKLGDELGKGLTEATAIARKIQTIIGLLTGGASVKPGGGPATTPGGPPTGTGLKPPVRPTLSPAQQQALAFYNALHNIQGGDPTRYTGSARSSPAPMTITIPLSLDGRVVAEAVAKVFDSGLALRPVPVGGGLR